MRGMGLLGGMEFIGLISPITLVILIGPINPSPGTNDALQTSGVHNYN